ncbi:MAG: cysteine desulfurase [Bacillati bacterium ANGP1]|uniref:cysteine desulfurase n=1 Tax=Candidatus Segetimicrobium genomatis TaxID=2569760 RepID=A0A537M6W5_9BACT|nr:MAG: cysteine desulfurase [Terrabacteria group bacterium ANGP1]
MGIPATIREDFPILRQRVNGHPLVYLDSASTSQKPRQVIAALVRYYEEYNANVHRGVYSIAERATAEYEAARAKVARFLGAGGADEIIFTRNVTEALNLVAYAWGRRHVGPGDEILTTEMEHHSNLVPWQLLAQERGARLRHIPFDDRGRLVLDDLDRLLTDRTRLVALVHVSNTFGTINPVAEIARAAHARGALVVVDGAQSTPHRAVDVRALGADFFGFTGHKMLAPMGIGGLWGRRDLLEAMGPFLGGGEMISDVWLDHAQWNELPWKYEAGTPNVGDAIALGAAVDYLERLGMDAVAAHEREITEYAMERLGEVPGLRLLGPGARERGGVVSFAIEGVHPHDVAQVLDTEGVCVRAGHHCTKPLHRKLGIGASVRASFYVYTIKEEIDVLTRALEKTRELFRVAG